MWNRRDSVSCNSKCLTDVRENERKPGVDDGMIGSGGVMDRAEESGEAVGVSREAG